MLHLAAPIAAASVFKDRDFYFSTAKVGCYSDKLRHPKKYNERITLFQVSNPETQFYSYTQPDHKIYP